MEDAHPRRTINRSHLMRKAAQADKPQLPAPAEAHGACACGAVSFAIDVPAVWAWHDHSPASRRAQGCAYATYVGSWRSRFRILQGADDIRAFADVAGKGVRSFCGACGTPLTYVRDHAPKMVNIPRALFETRTGREPRYHLAVEQSADWEYRGETLAPLKGYPGVMWARPKRMRRAALHDPDF
jgi:hypothetical protein